MRKPRWLIVNTAWTVLCVVAWRAGLLDAVIGGPALELGLLAFIGAVFAVGQGAAWRGHLDGADRIAQLLPKLGLVCFGAVVAFIGWHADFLTPAGKGEFTREIIASVPINVAAVLGLAWIESLLFALGYQVEEVR